MEVKWSGLNVNGYHLIIRNDDYVLRIRQDDIKMLIQQLKTALLDIPDLNRARAAVEKLTNGT